MGSDSQRSKQGQKEQKEEQFQQLFNLPASEVFINEFNCTLVKKVLLQGHLYLFDGYLCFYSNLFSVTKLVIKLDDVTYVRRAKTAGMFHVALEVVAGPTTYYFTSFLSREEAFKQIVTQWSKHSPQARFWLGTLVPENSHSNTVSEEMSLSSDVVEEPSRNLHIHSREGSSLRCESSESVNSDLCMPIGNGKSFTPPVEETHQRNPSLEFPPGGASMATLLTPLGEKLFSSEYINHFSTFQPPLSGKNRNSASFSSPDGRREVDSSEEENRVLANSAGLLFSPRPAKNEREATSPPHGRATLQPPHSSSQLPSPDSQASVDQQPAYAGRTAGVSSAPPSPAPSPVPTPKKDSAQQEATFVQVISDLTPVQSKPPDQTITAKAVKGKEASQTNTPTPSSLKLAPQETPIPSPMTPPGSVKMVSSQLSPLKQVKNDTTPAEPIGEVTAGVVGKGDRRETDAKIGGEEMDEEAPAMAATMRKVLVAAFDVSVEDFFRLIFSDKSRERIDNFFKGRGEIDFMCTEWVASETKAKFNRLLTFRHPLGLLVGPKSAPCRQTQTLGVYKGGHYMVYTEQHMAELMFCDTFSVHGRWDVTPVAGSATPQCQVLISMDVPFSKPCWLKGKIERDAVSESKGMYEEWMKFAQELVASESAEQNPVPSPEKTLESVDENSKKLLESLETKGVPVESQNEIRRMLQLPPLPVSRTWSDSSLSDAAKEEITRGVTETAEGSREGQGGMMALVMAWMSGMWALVGGWVRKICEGVGGNMGTMLACVAALQVAIFVALLFGRGHTTHLGGPSFLTPSRHFGGGFPSSNVGVYEVPWTPPPDLRTALYWKHRIAHMQAHLGCELERVEWHIQDMDGSKSGRNKGGSDKREKGEKENGYMWRT